MGGFGTAAAVGLGLAGAAMSSFVIHGMSEAGKLELALVNLRIATGANKSEMLKLQSVAMNVSGNTSQSVTTIAAEAAMMANKGLTKGQIVTLLPQFAAFADVQMRSHKMDPVEAISLAVKASHLLKAYSTNDSSNMLEQLNKLTYTGADLSKVVTQLKYFGPIASTLGLKQNDIMKMLAMMGQTGFLEGRGGTGFQNMLLGSINSVSLTAHRASKQAMADRGLGIIDANGQSVFVTKEGKLDFAGLLKHLQQVAANTNPIKYVNMLEAAFGKPGGSYVAAITSKAARDQMEKNIAPKLKGLEPIAKMQADFLKTYDNTVNLVKTNFQTLIAVAFTPLIKVVQPVLSRLADIIMKLAQWSLANPQASLKITLGLIAASITSFTVAGFIVTAKLWQMVAAITALSRAVAINNTTTTAAEIGLLGGGAAKKGGVVGKVLGAMLGVDLIKGAWSAVRATRLPNIKLPHLNPLLGSYRDGGEIVDGSVRAVRNRTPLGRLVAQAGDAFKDVAGGGRGPLSHLQSVLRPAMDFFGVFAKGFSERIGLIGATIFRLGTKFVPIVGWVMLAIDALNLFKAHATDIGWVLGTITRWLRTSFWPGIVSGVSTGMKSIGNAIMSMVRGLIAIVTNPGALFKSGGKGIMDWVNGLGTARANALLAFNQANNGETRVKLPGGGYQVVPSNYVSQTRGAAKSLNGAATVNLGGVNINVVGSSDPKATAREVVKHISFSADRAARSLGGNMSSPLVPASLLQGAH